MSLLYPEESYKITGAIYEVHKELGPGLLEKVYQEALEKELKLQGIPFEREKSFTIMYKGEELEQKYIADFVCYNKIVVELKAVDELQRPKDKTRTHSSVLVNLEFFDVQKNKI